ncbi:hypothetical protein ACJX0J_022627, partial [Zea mays]
SPHHVVTLVMLIHLLFLSNTSFKEASESKVAQHRWINRIDEQQPQKKARATETGVVGLQVLLEILLARVNCFYKKRTKIPESIENSFSKEEKIEKNYNNSLSMDELLNFTGGAEVYTNGTDYSDLNKGFGTKTTSNISTYQVQSDLL